MLDGLNNILALLLCEPDRGMAREFLLANRVLLAELERIAPATDGFGDTHPKAVLKAVLEYYGRHQSLPDERALHDYSQTIPHLNDDLGRGQKIRDQLEELKEWQPTMADPAVLPGYALNEARNMWLQQRLSLAARMCTTATEVGSVVRAAQDKEGISQATLYRAQKEMADVISDYGKPAYWELAVAKPKQPETARAATVEDIL